MLYMVTFTIFYHQYTPNVSIYIYIYKYHTWILCVMYTYRERERHDVAPYSVFQPYIQYTYLYVIYRAKRKIDMMLLHLFSDCFNCDAWVTTVPIIYHER